MCRTAGEAGEGRLLSLLRTVRRFRNKDYFDPAEFARFCCVGIANTLLDFGVYLLAGLLFPPIPSRVAAWLCAASFSYVLNKRKVFHAHTKGALPLVRFVTVNLLGLLLGLAGMELLFRLGFGKFVAYAATLPAIALGNYFGYKLWSFRDR
ncbi:MAG: GtrA family protein [Desulfovibrio sp.]|jgi:putative flippase GtrA|nr:GtrA family protein [Desulfovibrio sp.]